MSRHVTPGRIDRAAYNERDEPKSPAFPPVLEYDPQADAVGSYFDAIAEIKRRVEAGEELPSSGYFGSKRFAAEHVNGNKTLRLAATGGQR